MQTLMKVAVGAALTAVLTFVWTQHLWPFQFKVRVTSASYGLSCSTGARGNVTSKVGALCNGLGACDLRADNQLLGDPFPNCAKNVDVFYRCETSLASGEEKEFHHDPAVGEGYPIELLCP
jgi:hypothetical protein